MTKITLLFSIFCLLTFSAHAQVEFAPIGAEWVFNNPVDHNKSNYHPLESWMSYQCTGDSTIGNQTYRKVGTMLFRQQDYKVYLRHDGADYLVFDFDLEVGDTVQLFIPICYGNDIQERTFIVHSITTITVNNQPLKKIDFLDYDNPGIPLWPIYEYTEKLGNSTWLVGECYIPTTFLFPWLRCYKDSTVDYKSEMLLSYNISDCYYLPPSATAQPISTQYIKAVPNPVTDLLTIDLSDQQITNLTIIDISGKSMYHIPAVQSGVVQISTDTWPKGIYLCRAKSESHWLVWKVIK